MHASYSAAWLRPPQKLRDLQSASAEEQQRLKASYQKRLDDTLAKLKALQAAAKGFSKLQRLQAATDDTCTRLKSEMLGIKQQKVITFPAQPAV